MSLHIEVNAFKDLIEKYPTWDELKSFLESDEGGLFQVADKNDMGFCLIKYEKGVSNMDLAHSKWFRSVVWNTNENKPVCVSPPKAVDKDFPFKTIKEVSDAGIVCQELVEGFMINCFRVSGSEELYITSRSKLNATGKFYSEKSFRELFMEAYMNTIGFTHYSESSIQENSHQLIKPDLSKNEVATFFSFLVQHKEHRIVKMNSENKVYLIHSGVVYNNGYVKINDSPDNINIIPSIENIALVPKVASGSYAKVAAQANELSNDLTEVQKWIKKEITDRDWMFQGLVFKDKDGNRWKFLSEKYASVKTLRGNSPNIQERFAKLYTQNLVGKYLEYYGEDMMLITINMMFMDIIVKILYDNYVDLHILKSKKVEDIDKMFLPHLYSIHGIYLSHLRPNNKKVNFDEIKIYLHKQPWQRLVFLMKKLIQKANE
jgi:hypothetical protein